MVRYDYAFWIDDAHVLLDDEFDTLEDAVKWYEHTFRYIIEPRDTYYIVRLDGQLHSTS